MKRVALLVAIAAAALPAVMLAQEKESPAPIQPPAPAKDTPAEVKPVSLPWKCKPLVPKPSDEFKKMSEFFMCNLNIKDISRILAPADIPYTGFRLGKLEDPITKHGGKEGTPCALIVEVMPDSPAARSGLKKGDIVTALDGAVPEHAEPEKSILDFEAMAGKLRVGQTVKLSILSGGAEKEAGMTVGRRESRSLEIPGHAEMSFDEAQEFSLLEKLLRDNAIFDFFLKTASQIAGAGNLISNKTRSGGKDLPNPFRVKEVTYCLRYPLNTVLVSQQVSDRLRLYINRSNQNLPCLLRECAGLLDAGTPDWERFRDNGFVPSTMLDSFALAASDLDEAFKKIEKKGRNRLSGLLEDLLPSIRGGEFPPGRKKEAGELLALAAQVNYEKLASAALRIVDKLSPYNLGCMAAKLGEYAPIESHSGVDGDVLFYQETAFGKVIVGGKGRNVYSEPAAILIDLGGDDVYLDGAAVATSTRPLSVLIDFAGNDAYLCRTSGPCSAACGVALLLDFAGNDIYSGGKMCEGWASAGVALLADFGGEDVYRAESFCQGGAIFGIGILLDTEPTSAKPDKDNKTGSDSYIASRMSQGIGLPRGFGALIDCAGGDTYRASAAKRQRGGAKDPPGGFSQGCGLGMKPGAGAPGVDGGIGVLLDLEGRDFYAGDSLSQGASRWCSLGVLCDVEGDDVYLAGQYSQGAGVHLSAASLIDWKGEDRYSTIRNGSQGLGLDWSVGYLFDGAGDDSYTSRRLAQGAGDNVSIGMLVDLAGSDFYNAQGSAQGFGVASSQRNATSFGILFDADGKDTFLVGQGAEKNAIRGEYGVLIDK